MNIKIISLYSENKTGKHDFEVIVLYYQKRIHNLSFRLLVDKNVAKEFTPTQLIIESNLITHLLYLKTINNTCEVNTDGEYNLAVAINEAHSEKVNSVK